MRRRDPIPQIDLPTTSIKTLLIKLPDEDFNIPDSFYSIEKTSSKLSGFGNLASVKIVRPGNELPQELRNHTVKHPELGHSMCAVIEFEKTDDCQQAFRILSRNIRILKLQNEAINDPDDLKIDNLHLEEDSDDDIEGELETKRMTLPASITCEDINGWQVSLLGSGRNPRRHKDLGVKLQYGQNNVVKHDSRFQPTRTPNASGDVKKTTPI